MKYFYWLVSLIGSSWSSNCLDLNPNRWIGSQIMREMLKVGQIINNQKRGQVTIQAAMLQTPTLTNHQLNQDTNIKNFSCLLYNKIKCPTIHQNMDAGNLLRPLKTLFLANNLHLTSCVIDFKVSTSLLASVSIHKWWSVPDQASLYIRLLKPLTFSLVVAWFYLSSQLPICLTIKKG